MENQTPDITWQNIKDLSCSLSDEQLKLPVKWWSEGEGGSIHDANILDEDYVNDGEDYCPRSEMDPTLIDEDSPVFPKGTPMLWIL